MFKLKKKLYLLQLVSLIFLGLLIFKSNNFLYAAPAIDLDARIERLTKERDDLLQQLYNNFNNLSLDNVTRLIRMQSIAADIERVTELITATNQQLILRDQFQQQRANDASTSNQQNNNRRN